MAAKTIVVRVIINVVNFELKTEFIFFARVYHLVISPFSLFNRGKGARGGNGGGGARTGRKINNRFKFKI
jgi:hypothetical protein